MSSFQIALNAILPMFIMLSPGYFLRKISMVDDHTLNKVNKLCFKTLPAIPLYYNTYKVDIRKAFNGKLIVYAVITQIVILGISLLVTYPTEKIKKRCGTLARGIFHTNFVIFGTLIGIVLCGEGNIRAILLLIAITIPVQNMISATLLELFREGRRIELRKVFGGVITNPHVIAALVGSLTQSLYTQHLDMLSSVSRDLGRCGMPVALIVMGGLFNFGAVKNNLRGIAVGILFRLLIMSAILVPAAVWLGFCRADSIDLMCTSIAPCTTTSLNLASVTDSDTDLAAQLVVFTSVCSLGTIFMWIFIPSWMGIS